MYEKIVNYFETNLCIGNLYFRQYYKLWIIGIVSVLIVEIMANHLINELVNNFYTSTIIILITNTIMTILFLILIFVLPIIKIYKSKVKYKVTIDPIGILMNEDIQSAYRQLEITEMEKFLKKECRIRNVHSIDIIIDLIDEDIKNKYEKKSFMDKYFVKVVLPVITLILTVYFTNNNEQDLSAIVSKTTILILTMFVIGFTIYKVKYISIIPINKRENLLELKRVLKDIKIKWNK